MNKLLLSSALALTVSFLSAGLPAVAKGSSAIATLDTDNDNTVDLAEANKAAEAVFNKLEKDSDGTVDAKELRGRLSKKELRAADPDNDATLTKDEFLSLVGELFKKADPDNDGTLDAKELSSKPGKALLRAIR